MSGEGTEALLARIDERTKNTENSVSEIKVTLAKMSEHFITKAEFEPVRSGHVTKDEFRPVQKVVYGMVAFILLAVLGAVIGLVVMK